MKQLSLKQRQWLKSFHLISAGIWISSGTIMCAFHFTEKKIYNSDQLYMLNYLIYLIDMKILVPAAIACLFTGLLYSLFTNWGFFKHRWLIFKWIITIGIISLGTFFSGPWIEEMVQQTLKEGISVLQNDYYLKLNQKQFIMGICMNFTLIITVFISVFKPWKKNNKN